MLEDLRKRCIKDFNVDPENYENRILPDAKRYNKEFATDLQTDVALHKLQDIEEVLVNNEVHNLSILDNDILMGKLLVRLILEGHFSVDMTSENKYYLVLWDDEYYRFEITKKEFDNISKLINNPLNYTGEYMWKLRIEEDFKVVKELDGYRTKEQAVKDGLEMYGKDYIELPKDTRTIEFDVLQDFNNITDFVHLKKVTITVTRYKVFR